METTLPWNQRTVFNLTGLDVTQGAPATASYSPGIERSSVTPQALNPSTWSPDHPLFWVAGLLALTFGMVFASTTIRVGPAKAAVALGKE